jgi:bifunctional non-homologous end joining protein LigD
MPDLLPPMQTTPGQLPDDGDWVVEFAWEGLRCIAHVRPDGLRLRTANGRDVTASFPELAEPLTRRAPRAGMVLDGTVVAVGESGLPRRRLLQRRTATARPSPALVRRTPVGLIVADLLWLAGRPAVGLPYRRRRELLEDLGLARPPVVVSPSFPVTEAEAVMRTAEEYGAEALHAKHLDAPYRPGRRSRSWLRVPLRRSGLVVVGGWSPADPRRPDSVGALLLGVPVEPPGEEVRLEYVGRVGVGAGEEQREIRALLARWRRPESPFVTPPPSAVASDAQWVAPRLVGRVEFADWTTDGRLRLPAWRGLRAGSEILQAGDAGRGGPGPRGADAAEGERATAGTRWVRPRETGAGGRATAPGPAIPRQVARPEPGAAVPGSAVPGSAVPGSAVPGSVVPGSAGRAPGSVEPSRAVGPPAGTAPSTPGVSESRAGSVAPGSAERGSAERGSAEHGSAEHGSAEHRSAAPSAPGSAEPSAVEARRLEQHFVYNALNTIAALMRTDAVRARELLLGFADLTRAADRPAGAPGTLGDELAAVRAYLQLEQARFGPRLQVEITVDEGLHALPIAPRRVLDAVRAVVQQRIEPRPGGGTVTVTAERAGAGCLVRVGERDGDGRSGQPTLVAPT